MCVCARARHKNQKRRPKGVTWHTHTCVCVFMYIYIHLMSCDYICYISTIIYVYEVWYIKAKDYNRTFIHHEQIKTLWISMNHLVIIPCHQQVITVGAPRGPVSVPPAAAGSSFSSVVPSSGLPSLDGTCHKMQVTICRNMSQWTAAWRDSKLVPPWDSPSPNVGITQCWNTQSWTGSVCITRVRMLIQLQEFNKNLTRQTHSRETMAVGTKCLPCPRQKSFQ